MADNNTTKRYKNVNVKGNNNSKTLREQQDFIDSLFLNIIRFSFYYIFIHSLIWLIHLFD